MANTPDEEWMGLALELAHKGVGLASPNPAVGCVIVRDGNAVGSGWHEYDKRDHAEVVALAQAGENARGATAYVTLEPCSHTGRTGPCADALIRAGVARVVAATVDPNPLVGGRGLQRLREAGVEVAVGVLEAAARRLNASFATYIRTGRPLVILKAALSLDGRIAPPPGGRAPRAPAWLTSEASRTIVQRMRHQSDALITGINTVLDDDPLLTDRTGLPRRRPLLRVVLDSALRLPLDSALVRSAKDDVLVFCTNMIGDRARSLGALGVRVERIEATAGTHGTRISLPKAVERLGELRITSAMIEAGAQVNTSAVELGLVDRYFLFYAPLFLGSAGLPFVHGEPQLTALNFAGGGPAGGGSVGPALPRMELHRFGPDFAVEAWTRDPWG